MQSNNLNQTKRVGNKPFVYIAKSGYTVSQHNATGVRLTFDASYDRQAVTANEWIWKPAALLLLLCFFLNGHFLTGVAK